MANVIKASEESRGPLEMVAFHTVLRGGRHSGRLNPVLLELESHVDDGETPLAYADRNLPHGDKEALDVLLATDRQLMRLICVLQEGWEAAMLFHRLHVPQRFLGEVGLEIYLAPDEAVGRWDLAPAVPHLNIRLPVALRLNPEELWWTWEPPPRRERACYGPSLLTRAAMWREAHRIYHQNDGVPS